VEVQYNVDVVDDYTGEIYREGVAYTSALNFIESHDDMSIVNETVEDIPASSIDDAIAIRTVWVKTTDASAEESKREKTREFWGY